MHIVALLLHEIAPSGPWVPIAFIVLGLVFVIPLYLVRRKYGGILLVVATIVEVIAGAALAGTEDLLVPTAFGGAAAALILHLRALRRPDGHKFVDIGLAIAGFWLTLAMYAVVSFSV
jgi:hypothetical protein